MNRIKIFISYSSKDKNISGYIKAYFDYYYGFEVFIAHSDLEGGCQWEESIKNNLKNCDFFIPLISKHFKLSEFTDQETGMAIAFDKKIILIKLGKISPYGFIAKYQGLPCKKRTQNNALKVVSTIFGLSIAEYDYSKYKNKAINSVVSALSKSNCQRKTKILAKNTSEN